MSFQSLRLLAAVTFPAALLAGCADLIPETTRKPVSPPGIASVDDMTGGAPSAAPAGSAPAAAPTTTPTPPATPAAPNEPAPAEPAPNPPPANKGIIGKMTARVVDRQQAMAANSELVEVQNSAQGGDPVSFAASAYISIRSKASTFGFQNELKTFHALNERHPTYDEMTQMMKTHGITFAELPPYQMYGYDAKAGSIVILEDKADKARRYKEAGIPVE